MDDDILQVINVTKKFGGLYALKNVTFNIGKGEILGLIGPNGSGKTTMLNVITGFLKPEEGRVIYRGKDITKKPPHEIVLEGIVRTFQLTRPFGDLTALSNVVMGALLYEKDLEKARNEALHSLESVGIIEKKDVLSKDLTIADRKKLELARALVLKPKLLLLDEVMAGLTPQETEDILQLLSKLREEKGISMIIVEHVVKAVMKIADRIVVLDAGEKIAEGKPEEIANNQLVIEIYLGKSL